MAKWDWISPSIQQLYLIFTVYTYFYSGTLPLLVHVGPLLLFCGSSGVWRFPSFSCGEGRGLQLVLPLESVYPTDTKTMPSLRVFLCVEGVGWGCKGRVLSHSAILVDPRGSFGNLQMLFLGEWWWWYCVVVWGCRWSPYHFDTMCEECQGCSIHPTDHVN